MTYDEFIAMRRQFATGEAAAVIVSTLRDKARTLRTKPTPLVDLIPLLTQAADELEHHSNARREAQERIAQLQDELARRLR